MGLYGNELMSYYNTDIEEYLEEGVFKSPEGKSIRDKIKDKCKSLKVHKSIGEKIKDRKYDYDSDMVEEITKWIDREFEYSTISTLYKVTTYYNNAEAGTDIWNVFCVLKGKHVYHFEIHYTKTSCSLKKFKEKSIDDLKIPEDVIKYILKYNRLVSLDFSKSKVKIDTKNISIAREFGNYVEKYCEGKGINCKRLSGGGVKFYIK